MTEILTPVGRLVYGNLYKPNAKTNNDGSPKIGKDGTPAVSFDYGIAIPKGAENHWAETEWGQVIWNEGHGSFPNGEAQRPDFAWKIHDGDSTVPNKANKRLCDKEGYPGHWIVNFSSSFPSKYVSFDGLRVLLDGELIKPGYYIQIAGNVVGNKSTQSPGVYLNHSVMSLQSVYEEISSGGVDAATVGFGKAAMPNGMQRTTVPVAQMQAPPAAPAAGNPIAPPVTSPPPVTPVAPPASPVMGAPVASHAAAVHGNGAVQPIPGYGAVPPPPAQ